MTLDWSGGCMAEAAAESIQRAKPAARTRRRNMVSVDDRTHATLRALAAELGVSIQETAAMAVEEFRRNRLIEQHNAVYAEIRADPVRWQEELAERAIWDVTLADGLEDE